MAWRLHFVGTMILRPPQFQWAPLTIAHDPDPPIRLENDGTLGWLQVRSVPRLSPYQGHAQALETWSFTQVAPVAPGASDWYAQTKTPQQAAPYRGKVAAFDLQMPIVVAPAAADWYEQHRVRTIKSADRGRAAAALVEPYWTPIDRADWYQQAALRNRFPAYAGRAASQFEAQPFPVFPHFYGAATPRRDAPYRGAGKIFYADTAPAAAFQDFAWLFDGAPPRQQMPSYRGLARMFYADFQPLPAAPTQGRSWGYVLW